MANETKEKVSVYPNPFGWGDETVEVFKTTAQLRNASYSDVAEEVFTNTAFDSFVENIEAPTPQIRRICGIECPKKD